MDTESLQVGTICTGSDCASLQKTSIAPNALSVLLGFATCVLVAWGITILNRILASQCCSTQRVYHEHNDSVPNRNYAVPRTSFFPVEQGSR